MKSGLNLQQQGAPAFGFSAVEIGNPSFEKREVRFV